ncbi:uncharacterized protein LOC17894942 [Capsella rubella]|uniref:uncharacterized protein LOC17894942 n=1 Tax=Capsella rubella TaxID=81985 RepID=UPI000CD59D35|nr:uncharacterized protein LOC17894942 [Capsella rubella]
MFEACGIEPGIEILLPKSRRRPWDAPEGYICLYEDFFLDCGLWFPLPQFLVSYCARQEIAFSQLTVAFIRNAVGLAILAAAAGVVVDLDLFKEVTKYSFGKENSGMFETEFQNCRRCSKQSRFRPTVEKTESFLERLEVVKARGTLWMGDCEIPSYVDHFDGDGTQVDELQIKLGSLMLPNDEPQIELGSSMSRNFENDAPVADADVVVETTDAAAPTDDCDASRRDRSEEVRAARDGKKVSRSSSGSAPPSSGRGYTSRNRSSRGSPVGGSSVRREARRGEPIREIAEGVDHSFSFNYSRKDQMFFTHGVACADLASKGMSQTNRLVSFYEEQCRVAVRDSDLANAAAEATDRSTQSHLRNYKSEKSRCADLTRQLKDKKKQYLSETDRLRKARDESAAAERHKVAREIHEYHTRIDGMGKHIMGLWEKKMPLLMLSQVSGREKCLKKMVTDGTHIPLRNLAQVEQDHVQWWATVDGIVYPDILESDLDPFPKFMACPSNVAPRDGAHDAEGAEVAEDAEGPQD